MCLLTRHVIKLGQQLGCKLHVDLKQWLCYTNEKMLVKGFVCGQWMGGSVVVVCVCVCVCVSGWVGGSVVVVCVCVWTMVGLKCSSGSVCVCVCVCLRVSVLYSSKSVTSAWVFHL